MIRAVMTALAVLAVGGCTVAVRPKAVNVPTVARPDRVPVKVALTLPPGFEQYRWSGRPTSWSGTAYTAEIELGAPTADALRSHMASTFQVVPAGPEADLTIEPAIVYTQWKIDDDGQLEKQAAIGLLGSAISKPSAVTEITL